MSNSTTQHLDEVQSGLNAQPPEEQPADAASSVDKIRDIIFGSQIKSYDARFTRLEAMLSEQGAELKGTLRHQLESIQSLIESEAAAMGARLAAEREERLALISELERRITDVQTALDAGLRDLEAAMKEGDSTLRQELIAESRQLLDLMSQRQEDLRSLLETSLSDVRSQKADRTRISELFREMASQLADNSVSRTE